MSAGSSFAGAALLPGMPQVLASEQSTAWREISAAMESVRDDISRLRPDVVVLLSTQWFTVLGHQFQMDTRCRGRHVDENWYDFDYGHLEFDFDIDVEFTEQWAVETERAGFQARRTRYDDFPIDTGTIVAHRLALPQDVPLALVSCNLYAPAEDLGRIAQAGLQAADSMGQRVYFVAVSGLSSGLTQRWIAPEEDRVEIARHEEWDRRILALLADGKLGEVLGLRKEYAEEAKVDSQFRAVSFLAGTGQLSRPADVLAYGPLWGTGGAVVRWPTPDGDDRR